MEEGPNYIILGKTIRFIRNTSLCHLHVYVYKKTPPSKYIFWTCPWKNSSLLQVFMREGPNSRFSWKKGLKGYEFLTLLICYMAMESRNHKWWFEVVSKCQNSQTLSREINQINQNIHSHRQTCSYTSCVAIHFPCQFQMWTFRISKEISC